MSRNLIKSAKRLYKVGEFKRAGELFEQGGDIHKAIDAYAKSNDFTKAGHLAISLGKSDIAIKYYQRAGRFDLVAQFFSENEQPERAAFFYTRAGDHEKASKIYEKLIGRLVDFKQTPGDAVEISSDEKRLIQLAASANSRANNYLRAANLYQYLELFDEAGRNYELGKEYRLAGEAYQRIKLWGDAGEAFYVGKFYIDAARCYEADENYVKAAECYIQDGDLVEAGNFYSKAGDLFKASQVYEKADEIDLAIKILSKIKNDSSDFFDAVQRIVTLSKLKDYLIPAANRFLQTFLNQELTKVNAKIYFEIAELMEKSEFMDEARTIYQQLERFDPKLFQKLREISDENRYESESQASETQFKSILEEDFEANERELEFQRRKSLLKSALSESEDSADETLMGQNSDSTMSSGKGKIGIPPGFMHIQDGQKLGDRYMILESLGSGGMGSVYKARDLELDEICAIKILSPQLSMDESAVARFKQEIKLARQINHTNIIRIYDLGELYGLRYITMEFFPGRQIKEIINEAGPFEIHAGLRLVALVCEGLKAAHKLGIIHRDIKSQNIMMSDEGIVKVLDFGIAKSADIPGLTVDGSILGTPEYISPEAIMQKSVDERSDIYSLGIVIYEIFTGVVPFSGTNIMNVIRQHLYDDPERPTSIMSNIPDELEDLIMTCIEREPAERYQSIAELLADIKILQSIYSSRDESLDETSDIS